MRSERVHKKACQNIMAIVPGVKVTVLGMWIVKAPSEQQHEGQLSDVCVSRR